MSYRTLDEAAELLRISKATLRRLNRVGQLKFTRLSARRVIVKDCDIQDLLKRRTR
jgi:excisionase family DNA binding protein